MEGLHEDQEALFHSYPCAYYVQSPSTISHANSADIRNTTTESAFHSPVRNETNPTHETSRLALSHSSSRGSNHYFLHHEKKISYDARSHATGTTENGDHNRLIIVDHRVHCGDHDDNDDDDDDEDYYSFYGKRRSGWWKRYCSYRNSDSSVWICLQICWRAMLSFWIALLVFYIATKPAPPKVSIKVHLVLNGRSVMALISNIS